MATIRYWNHFDQTISLTIEPWADQVEVAPGTCIVFELTGDNAHSDVTWVKDGPMVFVWADRVVYEGDDGPRDFTLPDANLGGPPLPWFFKGGAIL